jgi:hypothetical protein
LRQAFTSARAISMRIPCDVSGAFRHAVAVAKRIGYGVAFSENEGYEAEALVTRGNTILLVKATTSTRAHGGTRVSVVRL